MLERNAFYDCMQQKRSTYKQHSRSPQISVVNSDEEDAAVEEGSSVINTITVLNGQNSIDIRNWFVFFFLFFNFLNFFT